MAKSKKNSSFLGYLVIAALVVAVPLTVWGVNISHQTQQNAAGFEPTVMPISINSNKESLPPLGEPMDFSKISASTQSQTSTTGYIYDTYFSAYTPNPPSKYFLNLNYVGNYSQIDFAFNYNNKNSTVKFANRPNPYTGQHNYPGLVCDGNNSNTSTMASSGWTVKALRNGYYYINHNSEIVFWCDLNFYYQEGYKFSTHPRIRGFSDGHWEGYQ